MCARSARIDELRGRARSAPVSGDHRITSFDRVGSIGRCVPDDPEMRVSPRHERANDPRAGGGCILSVRSAQVESLAAASTRSLPLWWCAGAKCRSVVETEVCHRARATAQPRFVDCLRDTGTDDLTPEHVRVGTDAERRAANLTTQRQVIVLGAQRLRHTVQPPGTEPARNLKGSLLKRC
jgi:hypothetical protein